MSWVQIPSPTPIYREYLRDASFIEASTTLQTTLNWTELRQFIFMSLYWINHHGVRLAILARPRGHDWLPDDLRRLRRAGVDVIVSALTSPEVKELGLEGEAEEYAQSGLRFVSFPIADRPAPTSPTSFTALVDRLAEYSKNGKAIAIHCRAGIGRSSMIAACVLVKNGLSPDAAFQTIEEARGCPVPDTHEQRQWVELWASDLGRAGTALV
jgi:protein-tyrosine phosphatase